mgnify:CR=1 FL=1
MLKAALRNLLMFTGILKYDEPYLTAGTTMKTAKVIWRPAGEQSNTNKLLAYPNPANNYIIVDFSSIKTDSDLLYIKVHNVAGKNISTLPVQKSSGFKVIDTRNWKPGLYITKVSDFITY